MSARAKEKGHRRTAWRVTAAVCVCAATAATAVAAKRFGDWGAPVNAQEGSHPDLNTEFNDGCPILSPDGMSLFMATNRPGGLGGQDIWVARRKNTRSGWGAPVNLGAPVNSAADDFCPTPVRGKGLFFVSKRPSGDVNGDIYFTRLRGNGATEPIRLGPNINSPMEEWSPSYFRDERGNDVLYFSRNPATVPASNAHDIYVSVNFGPAQLAPGGLNSPASEARPNVRSDGLEIVFDSNRMGQGAQGGQDVWTASRPSTSAPWPDPTPITIVNSPASETRASLSWDGSFLLFGSNRPGSERAEGQTTPTAGDIYVATRPRVKGRNDAD